MQISHKKFASILTAVILVSIISTAFAVQGQTPSNSFVISSGSYPGAATVTIYTVSGTTYAKNSNGAVIAQSTDATTVRDIATSLCLTADGGEIYFKEGTYTFTTHWEIDVSAMTDLAIPKGIWIHGTPSTVFKFTSAVTDYAIKVYDSGAVFAGFVSMNDFTIYPEADITTVYKMDDGLAGVVRLSNIVIKAPDFDYGFKFGGITADFQANNLRVVFQGATPSSTATGLYAQGDGMIFNGGGFVGGTATNNYACEIFGTSNTFSGAVLEFAPFGVHVTSYASRFSNNHFESVTQIAYVWSGANNIFEGNWFRMPASAQQYFYEAGLPYNGTHILDRDWNSWSPDVHLLINSSQLITESWSDGGAVSVTGGAATVTMNWDLPIDYDPAKLSIVWSQTYGTGITGYIDTITRTGFTLHITDNTHTVGVYWSASYHP